MPNNIEIELSGDASNFSTTVGKSTDDMEMLNKEVKEFADVSKKSFKEGSDSADKFNKELGDTTKETTKQKGSIEKLKEELNKLASARDKSQDTTKIKKFNKEIETGEKKIKQLTNAGREGFDDMGNAIDGAKSKFGGITDIAAGLGVAFGVQAVIGGIKDVVVDAINIITGFDQAIADLGAITGLTAETGLNDFKEAVLNVSKETGKGASDIAAAFQLVGSAKPELLSSADALAEVTKQAVILSQAGGLEVSDAADVLTKSMNQFGASADDAAKFTDILATSQQAGTATIRQLGESLTNVGAVANAAGLSFEETNVALQALAKGGQVGAEAGTGLKTVLSKLASSADKEINPTFTSLTDIVSNLSEKNLTLADANKLVGEDAGKTLLTLIAQKDVVTTLTGALNDTGNALEQAGARMNTVSGKTEEMKSSYERFILSIEDGSGVLSDFFKGAIEGVTDLFDSLTNLNDFDFKKVFAPESFAGFSKGIQDLAIEINGVLNPSLAEIGKAASAVPIDALMKKFSKLTGEQLKNKEVYLEVIGQFKALGLTTEEVKQKYEQLILAQGFVKKSTEEEQKAIEDNTIAVDVNLNTIAALEKKLKELKDEQKVTDIGTEKYKNLGVEIKLVSDRLDTLNGKEKKGDNEVKKAGERRIKLLEKIQDDFLKALDSASKNSAKIELDNLSGPEKFAKIKENSLNEIQILEDTINEKGRLLLEERARDIEIRKGSSKDQIEAAVKEAGELYVLTEEQKNQLEILKNQARANELSSIAKFNADRKLAEIGALQDRLDIQEQFALESVNELKRIDTNFSQVDFELFKQEEILRIQQEYSEKRIKVLEDEIQAKIDIAKQDGSISITEQNEIDKLELQKKNLVNSVELAQNERDKLASQRGQFSMAEFLGMSQGDFDKLKGAISQVANAAIDAVGQILDAQAQAVQERISQLDEQQSAAEDALDAELGKQKEGYASNVEGKKAELASIKAAKIKAQKDASDIAKKQFLLDTALQVQGLITSSIQIIKGFSEIPIVGLPLGIAAVAAMFGFFATAKAKAYNAIGSNQTAEKGAVGDKTGMIQGKRHYRGGERFLDHLEVEDGEKFGILNRGATNKHGKLFEQFTLGLNDGENPHELMNDLLNGTGVYLKKDIDKNILKREVVIKQQEFVFASSLSNKKMEDSMNNVDKNLADLLGFEKGKIRIIPTPTGRWEIDDFNKKRKFITYVDESK